MPKARRKFVVLFTNFIKVKITNNNANPPHFAIFGRKKVTADMYDGKFPLILMGGRAISQAYADGEEGPPLCEQKFIDA